MLLGAGKTHIGMVRENNEDAIYVGNSELGSLGNLFVVADGMGGHNAGDVASKRAINTLCTFIGKANLEDFVYVEGLLAAALAHANGCVHI